MKMNQLFNVVRWSLLKASVFSFVMMPVSQGMAAETQAREMNKLKVQNSLIELGLNKSITVGQFYDKNKSLFPQRIQKQLEGFIKANRNQPMPTFEVSANKNSQGEEIPTLRISQGSELVNVQIFAESDRYFRFNNSNLTEVDVVNFKDMFIKLYNGDEKLRRPTSAANPAKPNSAVGVQKSTMIPEISAATWKSMTPEQRAGYVMMMRLLWNDARSVLYKINKQKKTTALENFYKLFFQDAEAETKRAKTASSSGFEAGKACLIAGYVTEYSSTVCDHKKIKGSYRGSDLYTKAAAGCTGGQIACNPLVFGTPNGQPICITPGQNKDFQTATHFEGPCERNNHLGSKVQFLKDPSKKQGRYDTDNLALSEEQIKAQLKADQGEALTETKSFIEGILKFKDPTLVDAFVNGKMDPTLFEKLKEIRDDFNEEIRQAKTACIAASNENQKQEKNFWDACDQLQRRQIFVAEYLAKNPGCKDGGSLDPETLKCSCPGPNKDQVIPGNKCSAGGTPPSSEGGQCPKGMSAKTTAPGDTRCLCMGGAGNFTLDEVKAPGFDVAQKCGLKPDKPPVTTPGADAGKCTPSCTGDQKCALVSKSTDTGAEVWECRGGSGSGKPPKEKEDSNWFSGFFKKAAPWLLGGLAIFAMYKLWSPKKPSLNAAADKCPNGTNAPCITTCPSPQALINNICQCAACPPGQTLTNASACTCSTSGGSGTTEVTCPDGVTKKPTLAECPATQYTCWDGSKVANPINCPEKPATTLNSVPTGK